MSIDPTKLEAHLSTRSYVEGYTPSQADVHVFKALSGPPGAATAPHAARWYRHIQSYESEFGSLPGSSKAGEALTAPPRWPRPLLRPKKTRMKSTCLAERIKAERVAEYAAKKAKKPKTIAKSVVTLEDGLVWGASKLVPIGYGIRKLQITLVIEDELVSLDDLQEKIAEFDDYVQSSDVAAMQSR
ncbi:EF-1 guanine nucleotide exchange domain-containing protein [Russula compacta]|nr:EF-1 guanine nucleotide exchange domain-containing protein [Russula compacta]